MQNLTDLIVAPITGPGPAAVTVVRLSGPKSFLVAAQVFNPFPENPKSHRALYGRFVTGDDGLALPFAQNHSYTGDESVELSVHGSPASVRELLEACHQAGARPAGPGEFTLRAFMNGRLDLAQAEGVRATIEAQTQTQLRFANRLREGDLTRAVLEIKDLCLTVLAMVEASVDFSEEIGDLDHAAALQTCKAADQKLDELLATESVTRLHREGAVVALVGLPNAGKSSLLNALLKQDRAIVTPVPGTTRDTLEETVELDGLLVRLIDTAGLRETPDEIERQGVERARHAASHADLVLYLFDSNQGWTPEDQTLFSEFDSRPVLEIATKSDLPQPPTLKKPNALPVSTKNGDGLSTLITTVSRNLLDRTEEPTPLLERHYPLLRQAQESLSEAKKVFQNPNLPDDLASVALRQAIRILGEITGETAGPDLIDQIFSKFCIGK